MAGNELRPEDWEAGKVVAFQLGGRPVARDIAGAPDGTPDFEIRLDDGRRIALEVTAAPDPRALALQSAAFGRTWPARSLMHTWHVGISTEPRRIGTLVPELVRCLGGLEASGIGRFDPLERSPLAASAGAWADLIKLRVRIARSLGPPDHGIAQLFFTLHRAAAADPERLNQLVAAAAVANHEKLMVAETEERHLFVWVDSSSPDAELAMFQGALPISAPPIPKEIDAVWAGTRAIPRQSRFALERLWLLRPPASWVSVEPASRRGR